MKNISLILVSFLPLIALSQSNLPYSVRYQHCYYDDNGATSESESVDTLNIYHNIISSTVLSSSDLNTFFYHYQQNQLQDSIIEKFYKYNTWYTSLRKTFQYDINDTLTSSIYWNYNYSDTTLIDSSEILELRNYDQSTRTLHSESSRYNSSSGWYDFQEYDKKYDSQNRLIEHTQFSNFIPIFKSIYTYLNNDSISQYFNIGYTTGIPNDTGHYEYIYNSSGVVDTIISHQWINNANATPGYLYLHTYDSNNRLTEINANIWYTFSSIWNPYFIQEFDYYSTGNLMHFNSYQGGHSDNYYYSYDVSGNLDSTNYCHWNLGDYNCIGCRITETLLPTSINTLTGSENISVYPNPTTGSLYIDLKEFNTDINKFTIKEVTGKILMTETDFGKSSSIKIDISTLSAGIYFISFMNENQLRFTKKIIKS